MANALAIAASAFKQANLDQTLSSFSMTDFPYNCALDLFNLVIREMNRKGRYWFAETSQTLAYSAGVYQYNYNTLNIPPHAILRLRKEATDHYGELTQLNWREFQQLYRRSAIETTEPVAWSKYGGLLELSSKPDQDYTIKVYYLQALPLVVNTTDSLLGGDENEDVYQEGVYAYLLQRLARQDWQQAYQLFDAKTNALLADIKQDAGQPRQLPAAF